MKVRSLGYQTDLALLRLGGSEVLDQGDHLVVRTPDNPTYWWGNFLLLDSPPPVEETDQWLETFALQFPDARHVALGFDGTEGSVEDLSGFTAAGLKAEGAGVMTARQVHAPPRPNEQAMYRPLDSDDDWLQQVELRLACDAADPASRADRTFVETKANTMRALTDAGHGRWFGAFLDGQLASSMGLFTTTSGLARFQSVETHPEARGQGLAGTLVHFVSQFGFEQLGAHTLVMVADRDYLAIRIYRSVGFADTETQLQVERPPEGGEPSDDDPGE